MRDFISPNSLVISVLVEPSNGSTLAAYIFPTQQELQNRKIIAIESYVNTDIDKDPMNPGVDVLTVPVFNRAFLTLYTSATGQMSKVTGTGGKQEPGLFYDKLPLCSLRRVQNITVGVTPQASYVKSIFRIRPTELAFNKCKVEFPTTIAIAGAMSAVFTFHYLDEGDDGKMWI